MSEWKECKLGDVGVVVTGKTPSSKSPSDFGNDIPFVTPTDYRNYHKAVSFAGRYLSFAGAEKLKNKILPPQSVMVTCIGSDMGKVAINSMPVVTNQQINSIISNISKVDPDFLYYKLVESYDVLRSYGLAGTAVPIVNKTDFEGVAVLLPPLPEQHAITGVLSSLDDKIDLLHRQNKTLEGMARALWRKMFIEEADPGWKKGKLGNIADNVKNGVSAKNLRDHEHYVGLEHIERKHLALYNWGDAQDVESNKFKFERGDILFGKLRAYFHKVCFAPVEGICSTDILVIRPKQAEYFSFCLMWFFSEDVVNYSDASSGGTRMPRTNWETLAGYDIDIPDDVLLAGFNRRVKPLIDKIEQNVFSIRTLSRMRDALLPKLMSGEVRVKA